MRAGDRAAGRLVSRAAAAGDSAAAVEGQHGQRRLASAGGRGTTNSISMPLLLRRLGWRGAADAAHGCRPARSGV